MNQAAIVTGVKAQAPSTVDDLLSLLAEVKEGRVLSAASKEKIDAAMSAAKELVQELEALLAAAEPAKGHSALRAGVSLRLAQADYDRLLVRAHAAGIH